MSQTEHSRFFTPFIALVVMCGAATAVVAAPRLGSDLSIIDHLGAYLALSALLVIGELRPVGLLRLPELNEEPAAPSTTFVFAILLIFGFPAAGAAQLVASAVDDVANRKDPVKIAFNACQYLLSLAAASAVLEFAGWPLADGGFGWVDLPTVLLAGGAYYVTNNLLVGCVIALHQRTRILPRIGTILRDEATMEALLLGLSPLAAVIGLSSPVLLPLLLLPSLTIYVSSRSVLEMDRRARTDALTGLSNRHGFRLEVDGIFERERAGSIVLLDLDRFKYVNDTLGHVVGDHLITEVGTRLIAELPDANLVARLGGDEFVVFSSGATSISAAEDLAHRALAALAHPFEVDRLELAIEASAGLAVAPEHGSTADELLQRAEVAMYLAKSSTEQVVAYDPSSDQHSRRRLRLLGELRAAIAGDQLVLHYQPQADVKTGEVSGLEALIRWNHPELGEISPNEFVPQAEHSALVGPLTRWVLDAAIAEARRQLDQHRLLRMSVNLSPRALQDKSLPVDIAEMLQRHCVPAGMLTLEITESAVADLGPASRVLNALATMGMTVAIDDFGTGYASLTYLKRLPVSEIKLDRSFVKGIASGGHDAAIVRSTIELARELNLKSVAEGVETKEVADVLRTLRCDAMQGFLLSPGLPTDELDAWLAARMTAMTTPG